jgi:hypothetical protein
MTDTPSANGELIRTLIRTVDAADRDVIGALTATDVHFGFGNSDPPIPKRSSSPRPSPFAARSPISATTSSTCGRSTTIPT